MRAIDTLAILWGASVQDRDWGVDEQSFPGYTRVYRIRGGQVTYSDEFEQRELSVGGIYVFPSHATFRIRHNPDQPIDCIWIHLRLFPILTKRLIEVTPDPEYAQLFSLMECLIHSPKGCDDELGSCGEILVRLCLRDGYMHAPGDETAHMVNYLKEHADEPLHLREVARQFGYSREHFIKIFKKQMGITPYQFLISSRLDKACALLRGSEPVSVIAELVGYHDIKTFHRAFQKSFGRSAADYRKNYRKFV